MQRIAFERATVGDLGQIADWVSAAAEDCGFDARTAYQIQMAVDEACSNVILHGYDGRPGRLEIEIECAARFLEIRVRDWGRSFDPESVSPPDVQAPLDERPIGGLGLFFMRKFMDELEFNFDAERGNLLRMRRHVKHEA